jgi:hypothetical protein
MFAHDLCHSRIEYFKNVIDLDRKDRAKRYHKSSIVNLQSSIPVYPGWDRMYYSWLPRGLPRGNSLVDQVV